MATVGVGVAPCNETSDARCGRVSVSVVVITRDRPSDLDVCLRAILANRIRDFELVVVDQSADTKSARLVARLAEEDLRIRFVPDSRKGAARARNLGAAKSSGDIIVFTDDDCEADVSWLDTLVQAIAQDARVGIAYGSVVPAPHDPADGFIVGFTPHRRRLLGGRLSKLRDQGISANVAVRRSAFESIGGFDELLGPGGYFPCAEDFDLTYRVLSGGFLLLHVPEARVVHHGLRDWQSGGPLIQRTYVAIGAAYMKHLRRYDPVALLLLGQETARALANIAKNIVRRRGPYGLGRLRGLLSGMLRSFELKVASTHILYCPRD